MTDTSISTASIANFDILLPPEGVPLHFRIAGVGVRVGAQIVDILLTSLAVLAVVIILAISNLVGPSTVWAVGALLFFFTRIPYYVLSELAWNGQTLGKRLMKIKVVANDGGSLTTHALVVRNLMKEAEIFLPMTLVLTLDSEALVPSLFATAWTIGVLLVPLTNKRRRRLGDFIAGTYVIHLPEPILLKDLAEEARFERASGGQFGFLTHHLEHYGAYELQTLEQVLRAQNAHLSGAAARKRDASLAAIVEKIRNKIGYADAVAPEEHVLFLRAFYNEQRQYLEQRQLFGDQRADKFHAEGEKTD